jgi:hypothetical protein
VDWGVVGDEIEDAAENVVVGQLEEGTVVVRGRTSVCTWVTSVRTGTCR